MNAKMRRYYNLYLKSDDYKLSDVYNSFSRAKEESFNEIKEKIGKDNNTLKIISHCINNYTVGYIIDNKFYVETFQNIYKCDLN